MKLLVIHRSYYLFILLILSMLCACQELFVPENLDNDEKLPLIQGLITDKPGPYKVTLFWTSPYDKDECQPINSADVIIHDDHGNSEILKETSSGTYSTHRDGLRGKVGYSYTLQVQLPDGRQYESSPAIMSAFPDIKDMYAEAGTNNIIGKDYEGNIRIIEQTGLHVYIDINVTSDTTGYYRFITNSYVEYNFYGGPEAKKYCLSHKCLDPIPNIKASINKDTDNIIRKHYIGFLSWTTEGTIEFGPFLDGWITETVLYSINSDAYTYYQSIIDQLTARERIFAPISTQIQGNIKCISDPNKTALGIFEAAAIDTLYYTFYWNSGFYYYREPLTDYEWPGVDTCIEGEVPDYWVFIAHNKY